MTSRVTQTIARAKDSAQPAAIAPTLPAIADAITSHPKGVTTAQASSMWRMPGIARRRVPTLWRAEETARQARDRPVEPKSAFTAAMALLSSFVSSKASSALSAVRNCE